MKKPPRRQRGKVRRRRVPVPRRRHTSKRGRWVLAAVVLGGLGVGCLYFVWPASEPATDGNPPIPTSRPAGPSDGAPADTPDARIRKAFDRRAETIAQIQAQETALAEQLLKDFPNSDEAWSLTASIYRQQGDSATATQCLEQVLKINPHHTRTYEELGAMAKEKGSLDQAVAHWERGLKVLPQAPGLRWHIAEAMFSQANHKRALELLERECRITPDAARNYYLRGQICNDLARFDEARQDYEKAIAIDPRFYSAYYALGTMCLKQQQPEQAREYLSRFKDLRTRVETYTDERDKAGDTGRLRTRAAALYWKAHKLYSSHRRPRTAAQLLEHAMHLDPTVASYPEGRAILFYAMGDLPDALRLYRKARQIDPNNLLYYLNIGKISAELRQFDDALRTYQDAIARFPEEHLAYAVLARFYLRSQRRLPEAMALARKAQSLQATADNHFLLGWAYSANGDLPNALAAIHAALEMEPDNAKYKDLHAHIKSRLPSAAR